MRAASGPLTGGSGTCASSGGSSGASNRRPIALSVDPPARIGPTGWVWSRAVRRVPLKTVLREWGRIGVVGFGGPPAHIALLPELVVERRGWIQARDFEDANAACQLLPGPASTQMTIYCARRVAGNAGALAGGLAFILPGLVLTLAIAAVALQDDPPEWVRGLGAGAAAAVVAVVVQAGAQLARDSLAG